MPKPARNLYDLKPEQAHPFEELGDGKVDVLLPRYGDNMVGRLLKRIFSNRPVRVHLDDVGASVWRLCDGQRTVHEIGESLHERFGERIEPVYDRLETFLTQMKRSGLIRM